MSGVTSLAVRIRFKSVLGMIWLSLSLINGPKELPRILKKGYQSDTH